MEGQIILAYKQQQIKIVNKFIVTHQERYPSKKKNWNAFVEGEDHLYPIEMHEAFIQIANFNSKKELIEYLKHYFEERVSFEEETPSKQAWYSCIGKEGSMISKVNPEKNKTNTKYQVVRKFDTYAEAENFFRKSMIERF